MISPLDLSQGEMDGEQLQEKLVMEPIYGPLQHGKRTGGGIKSGAFQDPAEAKRLAHPLRQAIKLLAGAGADLVISGCTEIPLALGREPVEGIPLLDPLDVAARACVYIAVGKRGLPTP